MTFPSVPGGGWSEKERVQWGGLLSAVQDQEPSRTIFTFLLLWATWSCGSWLAPCRPLWLGSFSPPFCPSGCSPAEMAMRIRRARVYIPLHVSHLAKHESKALEEKLCNLPLNLQLPLTQPALWVSNNNNNKIKTKVILGNENKKFRKTSHNRFLELFLHPYAKIS